MQMTVSFLLSCIQQNLCVRFFLLLQRDSAPLLQEIMQKL